jgi:hypothetical protein
MFLLYILLIYILLVWIVARLVVPHLGFSKESIPEIIPVDLEQKITELHQTAKNNTEFIELAYSYVTNKYTGSRLKTITQFWKAFGNVFDKPAGFLPCTGQNYILRTILIKSGRFNETDIQVKTVPLNLFIHQYLQVKVGDSSIILDPWSHFLGIPLGKKSLIFG